MNDLLTKSFLSYVELKKQAQMDMEFEQMDVEKGAVTNPAEEEQDLYLFFQQVATIKSEMESVTTLLSHLRTLNEETKSTHSVKILRGLRDQMDSDTVSVLGKAKSVSEAIGSLPCRSNCSANRKLGKEGTPAPVAVDRTRVTVIAGLRIKLKNMMSQFQSLRQKILSDHKDDLKRTFYNARGREPGELSMEKMVTEGRKVEELYYEEEEKSKERHEAAMEIQRSLNKLHQVFLDMAVLVEAQEGGMEDIERNAMGASDYISGGTNSLFYANQMKKKKKTWVYWVWTVGLIILLVCLISMLTS